MKKVVLIVGHTPLASGALNTESGETEFDFNNTLVPMIAKELRLAHYQPIIVYRNTYRTLPSLVNSINGDIGISLHCNAFNTKTKGSEVLYWHGSEKGKELAECLNQSIVSCLGNPNRGVEPIDYDTDPSKNDNGGWLVEKTNIPVVISEAFFIDNNEEYINAKSKMKELAKAFAEGVNKYYGK